MNHSATIIILLFCCLTACQQQTTTQKAATTDGENPYKVERTFPEYLLEHRKLFSEKSGTYQAGDLPVWTIHAPDQWIGNITFIETKNEIVVFDCSVSEEAGVFALQEIRKVSNKPISTIFYSHHHADHYRGTGGLINPADVKAGKVKIYAWKNFLEEKESEFGVIANRQTMGSFYFSGALLEKEEMPYLSCCGTKVFGGKDV